MSVNPDDFVITRRRKKYRFALFSNLENCYELDQWTPRSSTLPLTVEVGAGTALFLVELATCHPERQFIALDIKADRLQKGAREAYDRGLTNISFVRARADQLLEVSGVGTIDELWLTFSDPFPKAKSAKHRLTHPRFLAYYRTQIKQDGTLRLKTDNHSFFDWSLEQLVADRWTIQELTFDLHKGDYHNDYKILTTFEARFVQIGLPIYYVSVA